MRVIGHPAPTERSADAAAPRANVGGISAKNHAAIKTVGRRSRAADAGVRPLEVFGGKMSEEIVAALITSVIGGLLVAIANHLFTRKKSSAEVEKLRAEAEKLRAETEKIKSEISRSSKETKEAVEKAVEKITGHYLEESETTKKFVTRAIQNIHHYLRSSKSERATREELIQSISPALQNNAALGEFVLDTLISKGYLIEASPGRYELTRTAKQKFISGGSR